MSFINLHFITIRGKRTIVTLPEDFQLTDILTEIQTKINNKPIENYSFFCRGKRLFLNNPIIFENQKRKLIKNGDVIFIGNKITNYYWNSTIIKENKVNFFNNL